MEIEKIVSNVQEKVGNTDFSAQTIQKACELFPVADGQEPDEAYFAKVADFVKGMQGQYNHDFSTKFGEFKKNFKLDAESLKSYSKEQIEELKGILSGLKTEKQELKGNEELDALKTQLAQMQEKLEAREKKESQDELMKRLKAAMKEQRANDEYVLDKTLLNAELDGTKPLEDLVKEWLPKYDNEYTACRGYGAPPRDGSQGGGKADTYLDRKFAQKKAKEGWGTK